MPELLPGCAFPSVHIVESLASKLPSTIKRNSFWQSAILKWRDWRFLVPSRSYLTIPEYPHEMPLHSYFKSLGKLSHRYAECCLQVRLTTRFPIGSSCRSSSVGPRGRNFFLGGSRVVPTGSWLGGLRPGAMRSAAFSAALAALTCAGHNAGPERLWGKCPKSAGRSNL